MTHRKKGLIVILSGILIASAFFIRLLQYEMTANWILIIATFVAGFSIVRKAISLLILKVISIELLVTIAVSGAIVIHEYTESAAVTFLFILGSYLENRTLEKTRSSIKGLLEMSPLEARVLRKGNKMMIAAKEVNKGEMVFIQSGEKIPVDGQVVKGSGFLMEAAITGESDLIKKEINDKVYSGTILDHGYLEIFAEKVGEDTTFAKIIELVEEAQESKAITQRFIEKFAQYYTPGILILSLLVYLFTKDITLTLTFLVIACPGALVISAPVSIVAGIGNGARKGILIKGGEVFEKLSKADVIAFDKTGTLTKGKPEVVEIITEIMEKEAFLQIMAKAEQFSEHPLGTTIVKEAEARKIQLDGNPDSFLVEKGKGIIATMEEGKIVIGNLRWLKENGIPIEEKNVKEIFYQESMGYTVVLMGIDRIYHGMVSIMDPIRPEAKQVIQLIKEIGIEKTIMLTGDNARTADKISRLLHVNEYNAELLPEDKVSRIKTLKKENRNVIMVGDGINDAPAIATSDIGIAMGGAASDAVMETADVILMSNRLERLPYALQLSKATIKNLKQNMFIAISVVVLLLLGVLSKTVYLSSGMFIHEFSVILVILNAIRLMKFDYKRGESRPFNSYSTSEESV
ncbi:heavy metal translocating P-type ATPase [Bacillus massilinigeriensis]|uniref:heavy metal translocating P-type ATPase n=1 Tax=Bacillus massilionigeriensis TaxID=1805475 RepID=UPI000A722DC7|nr:cation-translocating P-type ATPase [Bacillus massilionigeriensis]